MEKRKEYLQGLKIFIISVIEAIILFAAYIPLVTSWCFIRDIFNPELQIYDFYQNPYICLFTILIFIILGTGLFILFKFLEIKLISKHKKDSYQYMLLPCFLYLIAAVSFIYLEVFDFSMTLMIWIPLVLIIIIYNFIYEFIIQRKK